MPSSDMAIDMRRTKLKAAEAALLAGELKKPTWESRNEGIHERVSFEDAIWGFDLAGGAYYKTPLRVVAVKPDSRAEKAGIRPGDRLKRINDIDTSTLTIQEAHKIIIDSGIHLKIAVTAPEDEEDSYYCYEDPLEEGYDAEAERFRLKEEERQRQIHAKVSSYWSLQWPWVSKRRIIYRESNCFMVPSKYEDNHKDKFLPQPMVRQEDDIVLQSTKSQKDLTDEKNKQIEGEKTDGAANGVAPVKEDPKPVLNGNTGKSVVSSGKPEVNGLGEIPEVEEDSIAESVTESIEEVSNNTIEKSVEENTEDSSEVNEVSQSEEASSKDDDVINELLNGEGSIAKGEEENIIDSILGDSDGHSLNNSESVDER